MTAKRKRSTNARTSLDVVPSSPQPAGGWDNLWRAVAIVVLAIVAHAAALPGGFIWEDREAIAENPDILSPQGLREFWFSSEQPDYWPVAYTTLWLEYRVWGAWAPGFRAMNLFWHACNALLLWALLARLRVRGAWLCGAIFAVHPVTVESVAWCFQSKTLLSATFALLALGCYLRAGEARDAVPASAARAGRGVGWYAAALLLFLLGMLTKSSVVMWPFVLLLARWWQRRRLGWRELAAVIPFFLVSLGMGLVAVWFQTYRSIGTDFELIRDDGLASRLALAGRAIWFYVGKTLLPVRLSFIYPRWPLGVASPSVYLPDVALVGVFVAAWRYRAAWGMAVLVAGAYLVLNLFPVLGVTNIYFMRYSLVADHWQYLALPGTLALFVGGGTYLWQQFAMPSWLGALGGAVAVALLSVLCVERATLYRGADNEMLWLDVLAQDPESWVAQHELGRTYALRGDHERAKVHFVESLRINPTHGRAYLNLGLQFMFQEREAEAVTLFRRAVELDPRRYDAHFYLAVALVNSGDTVAGLEQLRRNIENFPGDPRSAQLLSLLWAASPDPALRNGVGAVSLGEQLCALSPTPPAGHLDVLASAYAEVGRFELAEQTARRALAQALAEGDTELAQGIRERIELYSRQQPYRRPL